MRQQGDLHCMFRSQITSMTLMCVTSVSGCATPAEEDVLAFSNSTISATISSQAHLAKLTSDNLVSRAEALDLAQAFASAVFRRGSVGIESIDEKLAERSGEPEMYVVHFERGGFALLSADKRQTPILAFSDTNDFDSEGLETRRAPEGVRGLLLRMQAHTHAIRAGMSAPVSDAQAFTRLAARVHSTVHSDDPAQNFIVPSPGNCTGSYAHTYELPFAPVWTQLCGYNAAAPLVTGGACGHAATGCVAVAVGQIMRYYNSPGGFDWGGTADGFATPAAAVLLRDVGDRLGNDWGTSTGANTANAAGVFRSYGYSSSARYTEVFWSLMPDELQAGRPVVMKGARDCDFLGFQTCAGHAWVITGVMDSFDCGTGRYGRHYKINWGWGGLYNGWHIDGRLNPNGDDFNFFQGVVLGIHP